MALGKITIVIGAGIIGSLLSKEGGLSDATKIFSSAFRIVTKHLQQDNNSSQSATKPRTDNLLSQVNSLRKELQLLASSRSVTIVTSARTGSRAYGVTIILIIGGLGYGYVWWKGWKLSDMMFVTKRGLFDACSTVGKQFEHVSSSITSAKRHLSSKIDVVDNSLDEMKELNTTTKNEVMQLHGDASLVHVDVESVTQAVRNLESKMDLLDEGQNFAGRGLYELCKMAEVWQKRMTKEPKSIQEAASSSLLAIEPPSNLGPSRTASMPPLPAESPSSSQSAAEPRSVLRPSISISAGGLKELREISNPVRLGSLRAGSPGSASFNAANYASETNSSASQTKAGGSAWKLPGFAGLTRTWSGAMN